MITSDQQIISHWALGPLHAMRSPESGTIHRTLLFTTSTGRSVLRAYRYQQREPVAREHALIAAVCARGLPAIAPIPRPSGETILEQEGHYYAVFPHAPGVQVFPGHVTAEHVAAMGVFLARLHEVLKDYPPEAVSQRSFRLNRAQTLTQISHLEALIRACNPSTVQDEAVLTQLAGQRTWLLQQAPEQEMTLLMEAAQVIHGDYQSTNLFFAANQVCAIIDWDQAYVASRAWEVMRTLDLVCQFMGPLCRAFLQGYRTYAALSLAALDQAAANYGLMRAQDVWPYEAVYVEGNDRVRRFLKPGGFVPLIERWTAVRPELT